MAGVIMKPWSLPITYIIDSSADDVSVSIKKAVKHIENMTPVRFIKKDEAPRKPRIRFKRCATLERTFCTSSGKPKRNLVTIWIRKSDTTNGIALRGSMIHELSHVLGLIHEHQRKDRDDYITLRKANMWKTGRWSQIVKKEGTAVSEYDYDSIMHYSSDSWSKNKHDTIIPKQDTCNDHDIVLGLRGGLSRCDIMGLTFLYDISKYYLSMMANGFAGVTLLSDRLNYVNAETDRFFLRASCKDFTKFLYNPTLVPTAYPQPMKRIKSLIWHAPTLGTMSVTLYPKPNFKGSPHIVRGSEELLPRAFTSMKLSFTD